MTDYRKKLSRPGIGKWAILAAALFVACYEIPDWFYDEASGANSGGGGYTGPFGSVTHGGKTYKTVLIGNQTWMAENLDYNVPNVTTDVCYKDNADYCTTYGRLYGRDAAMEACPFGWHLPSDAEWTALTDYVGDTTAGTKLKSTSGWTREKGVPAGTDDYGFSALPGGIAVGDTWTGLFFFSSLVNIGTWWSATESDTNHAWGRNMSYQREYVDRHDYNKTSKLSVRCVQD